MGFEGEGEFQPPILKYPRVVSDGILWQLSGAVPDVWDESTRYTCASATTVVPIVCAQASIFELFEGGVATVPSFAHTDLLPPLDATGPCFGEWLDYAGHAGIPIDLLEPEPELEPPTDSPTERGCATAERPSPSSGGFILIFSTLLARRRR